MKCIVFISLFYSLLVAENEYCSISDITENPSILSRQYYNIGDTISDNENPSENKDENVELLKKDSAMY